MSNSFQALGPLAVIGRGRLGTALSAALGLGAPAGRGFDGAGCSVVLLCVPDAEIAAAAAAVAPGPLVGHTSGATGLDVLAPHEAFGLHPLMSVTHAGGALAGAGCAIGGTTPRALGAARAIADRAGMVAAELAEEDRTAYHAAASIASNFLVTLEGVAERLMADTGVPRDLLVPLVRQTVEHWAAEGPERALTGPIARGDEATVAAQRAAVAERAPEALALFDALVAATRVLAAEPVA